MARVVRRRRITAPVDALWSVISDPYHLPRWWPGTQRVENVAGHGAGCSWTQVLETKDGRGIRADYQCTSAVKDERFDFTQQVEGTPFEKFLKTSRTEIRLEPKEGGTEVAIGIERKMQGLNRLGSPLMKRAIGRTLDETLAGLERAATGQDEPAPDEADA